MTIAGRVRGETAGNAEIITELGDQAVAGTPGGS
jgi:hypothetical protein